MPVRKELLRHRLGTVGKSTSGQIEPGQKLESTVEPFVLIDTTQEQQANANQNTKRKCMGIEPTERTVYVRPNGFEIRGRHQACKHFHIAVR